MLPGQLRSIDHLTQGDYSGVLVIVCGLFLVTAVIILSSSFYKTEQQPERQSPAPVAFSIAVPAFAVLAFFLTTQQTAAFDREALQETLESTIVSQYVEPTYAEVDVDAPIHPDERQLYPARIVVEDEGIVETLVRYEPSYDVAIILTSPESAQEFTPHDSSKVATYYEKLR